MLEYECKSTKNPLKNKFGKFHPKLDFPMHVALLGRQKSCGTTVK